MTTNNTQANEKELNAFTNGVLVNLEIFRGWGASIQLPDEELGELPKEIVKGIQDLLLKEDRELLNEMGTIKGKAHGWLSRNSIPFSVSGFTFIPKGRIEEANEKLKEFQVLYMQQAEAVAERISGMEKRAKEKYPKYFRAGKYKTKEQFLSRVVFRWSFRMFSVPSEDMGILSPEMYKEEVKKFKEEIKRTSDDLVGMISKEFYNKIAELRKACDPNEEKEINGKTVGAIIRFIEKFDTLYDGFIFHKEIKRMIGEMKDLVKTDTASEFADYLRNGDDFKSQVGDMMSGMMSDLKALPDEPIKRALDF